MPSNKSVKKRKHKKPKERISVKEKLSEVLELPKEIMLNMPKFTIIGHKDIIIENYRGIIEYDTARIRINTGIGVVKLTGEGMVLKELTSEDVVVKGEITAIEFMG